MSGRFQTITVVSFEDRIDTIINNESSLEDWKSFIDNCIEMYGKYTKLEITKINRETENNLSISFIKE